MNRGRNLVVLCCLFEVVLELRVDLVEMMRLREVAIEMEIVNFHSRLVKATEF